MGDRKRRAARVTVVGIGRIERDPEVARAIFSVEAARETAEDARAVAAAAARSVVEALRASGVAAEDVRTASIDVSPAWDHRDGRPVRTGFTVVNRLGVTVRNPDAVGRAVDAALGAGATGLDGVAFGLADATHAASEARGLAVRDARARAEGIADAARRRLGTLIEVVEGDPGMPSPRPMGRVMLASGLDAPTPVLPGRVEVTVSVVATWELD